MKNHFGFLPSNFCDNIMPQMNFTQLGNRVLHIALNQMYDYKTSKNEYTSSFKSNCIHLWNSMPFDIKVLPYLSGKENMHKAMKLITQFFNMVEKSLTILKWKAPTLSLFYKLANFNFSFYVSHKNLDNSIIIYFLFYVIFNSNHYLLTFYVIFNSNHLITF